MTDENTQNSSEPKANPTVPSLVKEFEQMFEEETKDTGADFFAALAGDDSYPAPRLGKRKMSIQTPETMFDAIQELASARSIEVKDQDGDTPEDPGY